MLPRFCYGPLLRARTRWKGGRNGKLNAKHGLDRPPPAYDLRVATSGHSTWFEPAE